MSNGTYSPTAFRSAARSPVMTLVSVSRELFSFTPLGVLLQALKAPTAKR